MDMKSLEACIEEFKAAQEEFKKKAQESFKLVLAQVFKDVPELVCIAWTQYTPYFNDGDSCEFSVSDVHFVTEQTIKDYDDTVEGDYADMVKWATEQEPYDLNEASITLYHRDAKQGLTLDQFTSLKLLGKYIGGDLEDVLHSMFGDHVSVMVTRDSIEVNEYDHE